jgi:hypothetical protein
MPRFHIEPDGQYYAVYEGSEFRFSAPTLFKAEIEMKLWQERVETAERLAAAEARLGAAAAEIERLKEKAMDFKNADERAQDGADESVRVRRDKAKLRTERAEALIIDVAANGTLTRPEIVSYVQANWVSPDWTPEDLEFWARTRKNRSTT